MVLRSNIREFYEKYRKNLAREEELDELLFQTKDQEEWMDQLREKTRVLRGIYVENEAMLNLYVRPFIQRDKRLTPELAEEFLKADPAEPMLFYVWGHSYEFDVNRDWERIETFCRMMSGKDDIFYGTNRECLELFGVI